MCRRSLSVLRFNRASRCCCAPRPRGAPAGRISMGRRHARPKRRKAVRPRCWCCRFGCTSRCEAACIWSMDGRGTPSSREELQRLAKVEELTAREREVLSLLARSLSNKEIAEELLVSAETVKAHIKNLFKKLGVDRRMKAVSVAKTLGWLDERGP
ncbi:response regulator transcription factor [Paenibacillus dendritiformis]|uniref:helix-turn-helix transcriptional regulator n=1 Tax=Paenibacillus dendritiformis TaxID=130049 RepID=UPI0030B8CA66